MSDLRERKKARTREAIQREALRLISEQGYDATTCEQIAAAAEVSPATFYRYFPTKEDVVLQDVYDPMIAEAVLRRPVGEDALSAVRNGLAQAFSTVYGSDIQAIRQRTALILSVPALHGRSLEQQRSLVSHLTVALEQRATGAGAALGDADIDVAVSAAACAAALGVAVERWARSGGDLPVLVDDALVALGRLAEQDNR